MRLGIEELYYISAWRLNKSICLKHLDHTHTHTHTSSSFLTIHRLDRRGHSWPRKKHTTDHKEYFSTLCVAIKWIDLTETKINLWLWVMIESCFTHLLHIWNSAFHWKWNFVKNQLFQLDIWGLIWHNVNFSYEHNFLYFHTGFIIDAKT